MDNEVSAALNSYVTENDMTYQLVPPHCHRSNTAERAIRTFKEHFVAGLSSVDPDFQMHLCDRLMPQAEITLEFEENSVMVYAELVCSFLDQSERRGANYIMLGSGRFSPQCGVSCN
jgi:hypothetical protein